MKMAILGSEMSHHHPQKHAIHNIKIALDENENGNKINILFLISEVSKPLLEMLSSLSSEIIISTNILRKGK